MQLALSCTTEDEHHFENKLFISVNEPCESIFFETGTKTQMDVRLLKVATALQVEEDVHGRFVYDPSFTENYNQMYYDSAIALPDSMVVIEDGMATIKKGSVKSDEVKIAFRSINNLDRDQTYVAAIRLVDVKGISSLNSQSTVFFVFKGASMINVVAGMKETRAFPDWKDPQVFQNLEQMTYEALVYVNKFDKLINTVMGIEDYFLLRIGDEGITQNQIQLASDVKLSNTDLRIETHRWYHIAVSFNAGEVKIFLDGKEKCSGRVGYSALNLGAKHHDESDGSRCFWVGYSFADERYLNGYISEVRMWNKALGSEELNQPYHFYTVDPESEGLIAYWKFNEGNGNIIRDYSRYGNNLSIDKKNPDWKAVELPQRKK